MSLTKEETKEIMKQLEATDCFKLRISVGEEMGPNSYGFPAIYKLTGDRNIGLFMDINGVAKWSDADSSIDGEVAEILTFEEIFELVSDEIRTKLSFHLNLFS